MRVYNVEEVLAFYENNFYEAFSVEFSNELFPKRTVLIFNIVGKKLDLFFGNEKNERDLRKFHALRKETKQKMCQEFFISAKAYLENNKKWPKDNYVLVEGDGTIIIVRNNE